jgi:hypothetical protein
MPLLTAGPCEVYVKHVASEMANDIRVLPDSSRFVRSCRWCCIRQQMALLFDVSQHMMNQSLLDSYPWPCYGKPCDHCVLGCWGLASPKTEASWIEYRCKKAGERRHKYSLAHIPHTTALGLASRARMKWCRVMLPHTHHYDRPVTSARG